MNTLINLIAIIRSALFQTWSGVRMTSFFKSTIMKSIHNILICTGIVGFSLAGTGHAAVIADLREDYVAGTTANQTTQNVTANTSGLGDTAATGVWNFYSMNYNVSGDFDNPGYDGALTLLPWGTDFSGSYQTGIATISANEIWDVMAPATNELAWHGGGVPGDPYNGTKRNTVIRWTAGASAPTTVDLSGAIRLPYSTYSSKTVGIYVNGINVWSYTAVNGVDTSNSVSHSYGLNGITISPGSTIDYVLESGSAGRAAISAQISAIPEPAALGMLGVAASGLMLRRRRANR